MPIKSLVCKKKLKGGIPCGWTGKSLRGWKTHMAGKHGGWSQDELAEIAGNVAHSPDSLKARMEQTAQEVGNGGVEVIGPVPDSPEVAQPTPQMAQVVEMPPPKPAKTVKATPRRLQKILSDIPAKMLESTGMKLDEEDREAMQEAGEFLADVFGIEFKVEESNYVVTNRLWAFVWVFGVVAVVWIKHNMPKFMKAMADGVKKKEDKKPAPAPAPNPPQQAA
jgi:hypothetical protein